jgi:hypothetical protein
MVSVNECTDRQLIKPNVICGVLYDDARIKGK